MYAIPEDLLTSPNRALTSRQAAGYLGISVGTMHTLRKRFKIPFIDLKGRAPNWRGAKGPYVFLLKDLDEFVLTRRVKEQAWNKHSTELPMPVVERLLRLSTPGRKIARNTSLADYSEASIRQYLVRQILRRLIPKIRKNLIKVIPRRSGHAIRLELNRELDRIHKILLADTTL